MRMHFWAKVLTIFLLIIVSTQGLTQNVVIKEEKKVIKTYPFYDPNPTPFKDINRHIYPYFHFEGYSHQAKDREWTVVTLENPYIKVYVLPEVGGKVWGAIEKSTNEEFIYLNEVLKFRNIAMRGPWISGGIEFNFGLIGHAGLFSSTVFIYFAHETH